MDNLNLREMKMSQLIQLKNYQLTDIEGTLQLMCACKYTPDTAWVCAGKE